MAGESYDGAASAYGVESNRWSYLLCRTRSGLRIAKLEPVSNGSWARKLSYKGKGSQTFSIESNTQAWAALRPAETTLVVSYDGQPVYAGIIWKGTYNRTSQTIDLEHEDIWSIWEKRLAIPQHLAYSNPGFDVIKTRTTYENLNLRTHAKRVIQLGLTGPRDDLVSYELPIAFDADQVGGYQMAHWTYDFHTVAERLMRISETGSGPNIDFLPRWRGDGAVEWKLEVSYSRAESLLLNYSAEGTPVSNLTHSRDLTQYYTEVHATGEGSETGTLHRRRWLGDGSNGEFGVPLAMHASMSDIKSADDLADAVQGMLVEHQSATAQTECKVLLGDEGISPHDLVLGMTVTLRGYDDPILPRGDLPRTLIGFSSVDAQHVKLELAPIPVDADMPADA